MEGTRGKCLGSLGVATSEAAFCSMCPARASHLNQLRMAASARAAEAFDKPAVVQRAQVGADVRVLDAVNTQAGRCGVELLLASGQPRGKSAQLALVGAHRVR